MSLTTSDLQSIRDINREVNSSLEGKVEAAQNDVKEMYYMLAKMQNAKLEDNIKSVHSDQVVTAKEAGITLPL